ncbi:MAG: SpoIIE family protein phosphatase [Clostridia bacterium]|nr:SpoIIE family protein phosphatase [Clostridia bacterium]
MNATELISKLIGTLAVILVISAFIGGSDLVSKVFKTEKKWIYSLIMGFLGGIFGIYGNISGFELNGAVISVRDIGPMLAGFTGGPIGGLLAGLIAGIHRLTMGGLTAQACVVATCLIGIICGLLSIKWHKQIAKPYFALLLSAAMEAFHLCIVLLMVKPFETALDIVKQIALPFIVINALGFMMMIAIMTYTEKQRALALEKSRLQSELEVANVIQHSLLPTVNEDYPGCRELDVSASMEAAKEVGGDFYDLFFVDSTHIAFVIGDVSGKGVPAALFMATSKITLQNCIRDIPNLSEAIETANNSLCARNDAEMFVTLWVGVLDLTSGLMTFVSAGHNPPVLLHNGKADFMRIKNGFVLAGMEGMKYKQNSVQLEEGDTVYLYTDGITEAEDAKHNLFGEERLLNCFENKSESSSAQILEDVKNSIDGFINGNSQFDDMTMLCFRFKEKRKD